MQTVTLKPRMEIMISVEAENISPDRFAGRTEKEIQSLEVWMGNRRTTIGELFSVKVEGEGGSAAADTEIIMEGDFSRVKRIGEGMTAGSIMIKGNVDMHLGAKMSGGKITVAGNADSWAGREMKGGEIIIEGDAGYYLGSGYRGETCGMRGGKITVLGNALDFVGEHMCGGEIVVKGNAGLLPGLSNNGGKIIIGGSTSRPGSEMAKGTIIINGAVDEMMPVYRQEGTEVVDGVTYRKYTGDVVVNGKGLLYVK
ncbi:formylmethanofuran dehydrogenase, subunit C [Candidatus Methanoperedens nitroreducens]|uniref:formylmethanofuran dehydrogenase n=1 Tax=Candidatus Methanoperedens nitratireducens TaxID=1392998 RepID=A0A062UZB8_9EURY|nr:formylmethanofuran dehydrogenase subunit C [Candidatus Methanoperedens nitroreducens]KCZ72276.1 formylmethanofuran dehydrogenase, subunit C [Candidatus Methanoperedens nitroreducens]MDJ1420742.1 formylmethanofuran dehydrogenase subunit C [Candidatus Methanoperedens sp.]